MDYVKLWKKYNQIAFGGLIILIILLTAVFAPYLVTHDPLEYAVKDRLQGPSSEHIFGTDAFGRDIFSRIIYGSRISMTIAISVLVLCGSVGTFLGLMAGYFKSMEGIIMRVMDALMAFPSVLLALVVLAV
ncbi:MAG: ABC transporter permease, partial [Mahellales bacterium]